MTTTPKKTRSRIGQAWDRFAARCNSLSRPALAWGGLALAGVILLSVNLISSIELRDWQADLTEERLFTISDGTREVLRKIEEPISVRLYFSKRLGEASPVYARYFNRVQRMIEHFYPNLDLTSSGVTRRPYWAWAWTSRHAPVMRSRRRTCSRASW